MGERDETHRSAADGPSPAGGPVLRRATALWGATVHGRDADIGVVEEILFDDAWWTVRYVLVETGDWLAGRWVLIAPAAVTAVDDAGGRIDVAPTRAQIASGPALAPCRQVSRACEDEACAHHGWPRYWREAGFPDDARLHRSRDAIGCGIRAAEGSLGHIADLLIDRDTWRIRRLAMDPRPPSPPSRSVTIHGPGGCMADDGRERVSLPAAPRER